MTSSFSHNFRVYNAERFIDSINTTDGDAQSLYLTVGKSTVWSDENSPPDANTSINAFNEVWRYMIGAKKISGNDVRLAIRRNDWQSGTVYSTYLNTTDSSLWFTDSNKFYVMTDEYNVYKCLSNNGGSPSTVKPTSTLTTGAVETADRYIWKYMYTLTSEERLRFMTDSHIPIRKLTEDNGSIQWQVQDNAIEGSIEAVIVLSGGSGYSNANSITVTISGDGTGLSAIPRINTSSNVLSSILVTNPGSGYSYANVVITDAGTGLGATAIAPIPPSGGHGSDPLRELGASFVIINPRIRGSENGKITVDNEFRQISIIKSPLKRGSSNLASNTVYSQTTTLTLDTGASLYEEDERVYQGPTITSATFTGTVVSWDASNNIIQLIDVSGTPQSDVLSGVTSRASRLVQSITEYDLKPRSGELLYIKNIVPIQRAEDQTEDIKIVIEF